jgi:hypothetical protein
MDVNDRILAIMKPLFSNDDIDENSSNDNPENWDFKKNIIIFLNA